MIGTKSLVLHVKGPTSKDVGVLFGNWITIIWDGNKITSTYINDIWVPVEEEEIIWH